MHCTYYTYSTRYEDAVALNNAMSHLQLNQPLDASQLDDDGEQ